MSEQFNIRLQSGGNGAELLIYDGIGPGGVNSRDVLDQLNGFGDKPLSVRINSGGGSASEAVAIYNALDRYPGRVVVEIDALAASAASFIAMAGDEILMAENALLMIHEAWAMSAGTADDFDRDADLLRKVSHVIADAYVSRTRNDREQVEKWMREETWFTADEAVEHNFADRVTPATERIPAAAAVSRFAGAAAAVARVHNRSEQTPEAKARREWHRLSRAERAAWGDRAALYVSARKRELATSD